MGARRVRVGSDSADIATAYTGTSERQILFFSYNLRTDSYCNCNWSTVALGSVAVYLEIATRAKPQIAIAGPFTGYVTRLFMANDDVLLT